MTYFPFLQSPVACLHENFIDEMHILCHCDLRCLSNCYVYTETLCVLPSFSQVLTVHPFPVFYIFCQFPGFSCHLCRLCCLNYASKPVPTVQIDLFGWKLTSRDVLSLMLLFWIYKQNMVLSRVVTTKVYLLHKTLDHLNIARLGINYRTIFTKFGIHAFAHIADIFHEQCAWVDATAFFTGVFSIRRCFMT